MFSEYKHVWDSIEKVGGSYDKWIEIFAKIFPLPANYLPLPALGDAGPTPVQILQPYWVAREHPETLWDIVELSDEIFLYEEGDPALSDLRTPDW